jgi:ABC-type molybdate transport system substrate-binding protein
LICTDHQLCALAREGMQVAPATLLDTMLDTSVRFGTSTPEADPWGDYAFALLAKTDKQKSGARTILESKALQLTGGPTSEKGTRRQEPVRVGDGERQGGRFPHQLHQCRPGAEGCSFAADRADSA